MRCLRNALSISFSLHSFFFSCRHFKKGNRKEAEFFFLSLAAVKNEVNNSITFLSCFLSRAEIFLSNKKALRCVEIFFLLAPFCYEFSISSQPDFTIFILMYFYMRGVYNEKDINWISVLLSAIDFDGNFYPWCWIFLSFDFPF